MQQGKIRRSLMAKQTTIATLLWQHIVKTVKKKKKTSTEAHSNFDVLQ